MDLDAAAAGLRERPATARECLMTERLERIVVELVGTRDHAEICSMQADIHTCLCVRSDDTACALLAFQLGSALSSLGRHTAGIVYLNFAHKLHQDICEKTRMQTHTAEGWQDVLRLMAIVCCKLARVHAAVKDHESAAPFLATWVEYTTTYDDLPHCVILSLTELAQNQHMRKKHLAALTTLQQVHLVTEAVHADGSAQGIVNLASLEQQILSEEDVCPLLIAGRCHVALGRYNEALETLLQAQKNATRPVVIATTDLYFAVVLWAYIRCMQRERRVLGMSYENEPFIGPALSAGMVLRQVMALVSTDASVALVRTAPGSIGVFLQLNALGEPTGVRQPKMSGDDCMHNVLRVHWRNVRADPLALPRQGEATKLELSFQTSTEKHVCCPLLCVNGTFESEFAKTLEEAFRQSQTSHSLHVIKSMRAVDTTLAKVCRLAGTHNLDSLRQDAIVFQSFLLVEQRAPEYKTHAIESLQGFLQHQVNDAKTPKCNWCRQTCEPMLKCGGCRVVRFCSHDTKHQKMATTVPFFGTSISHKKICALLKHCKSLIDLPQDTDPTLISTLQEAYDAAVWVFLQQDLLEKFVNNEHIRGALYAGGAPHAPIHVNHLSCTGSGAAGAPPRV